VETAEAIARATFAACRSQRDNLIALHNRYGYPGFSEIMDEAERRLLSDLMLEVMYTRKAMTAPPPDSTSPLIRPKPDNQSI
jgi:hypothetical protein